MDHQYTPEVSQLDVERVVRRDYPGELHEEILRRIAQVEVIEKPRVMLACLKKVGGDFKALVGALEAAGGYWREIISAAEYPHASKKWSRVVKLPPEEQSKIFEKDRDQYLAWLHRLGG